MVAGQLLSLAEEASDYKLHQIRIQEAEKLGQKWTKATAPKASSTETKIPPVRKYLPRIPHPLKIVLQSEYQLIQYMNL